MRYAHPLYIANFSAVKTEGLPYYHPSPRTKFSPNTKNPPFAINSGLFIFNSQHSSKWCPAVKHNALTATTSPHRDRHSALSPRPAPPHLPPLSKGGGLTAKHKLLLCCFLLAICPPFIYCKLFCRQDGGIAVLPSLAPHQTLPKHKNPPFALNSGFFIFNSQQSSKWCPVVKQ